MKDVSMVILTTALSNNAEDVQIECHNYHKHNQINKILAMNISKPLSSASFILAQRIDTVAMATWMDFMLRPSTHEAQPGFCH